MPPVDAESWTPAELDEIEANYLDERSARWMYKRLADLDDRPRRSRWLNGLADYEEKHSGIWADILRSQDRTPPPERPFAGHRVLAGAARAFGVGWVLPLLHKEEVDGVAKYRRQSAAWAASSAKEAFKTILPDEIVHEVDIFREARMFGGERGALRSAILGANDGLGSILALAAGVAAGANDSGIVLLAGVSGLVAGAVSMAASNYVSVKAEQEIALTQERLEREAAELAPDTKQDELVEAFVGKGLAEGEARPIVERLARDREAFVHALLQTGKTTGGPKDASPLVQAAWTGGAFLLAGVIPLFPYLAFPAWEATLASVAVTAAALFAAGILRALSTLHSLFRSGIEMVVIGLGSAAVTYLVGLAIGGFAG